jgi:pyruvate,orthophosphate dikinase
MFFDTDRLPLVRKMITAVTRAEARAAAAELLPMQRNDFAGLFKVMKGRPVTIRLIDPPLHEFLPKREDLIAEIADLKIRMRAASSLSDMEDLMTEHDEVEQMLERVAALQESNPMLGLRGVRLGILHPEFIRMQVRAMFEAAAGIEGEGTPVALKIMIPLTSHAAELAVERTIVEEEAAAVSEEMGRPVRYEYGTMIEVPRAALTADEIAKQAEFLSFGTNDLTQMTYGISRDDAEASFLLAYLRDGILERNPFASLDADGVGELMRIGVTKARATRPDMNIGICGEHGGDPASIAFCREVGLDYVSCSALRVPVARLAAAQAALRAGAAGKPDG